MSYHLLLYNILFNFKTRAENGVIIGAVASLLSDVAFSDRQADCQDFGSVAWTGGNTLVWGQEKRVITGADILGRCLQGVAGLSLD